MRFITKIILDIFGNKASMVFALVVLVPMVGTAVWKWNAWLESREQAAITKVMYEQEKQTTATLSNHIQQQSALTEKDQRKYANLVLVKEALQSAKEQAIKELNQAVMYAKDGDCNGNDLVPTSELWVLETIASELVRPEDLYGGCNGAATGCAATRLRNAIAGRISEKSHRWEDTIHRLRVRADQDARRTDGMRPEQRSAEVLEETTVRAN